jgi:exodeoxyribonuclease V gamma subunit
MSGLHIYVGNRLETLMDAMAEAFETSPLPCPLQKEIVVVQSKGMERWISMELAKRFGICANVDFPFPNSMMTSLMKTALTDLPDLSLYGVEYLQWIIMRLLPDCLELDEFASIRHYLQEKRTLKTFQLAAQLALTFDKYMVYRPNMVVEWFEKPSKDWQAQLWRRIVEASGAVEPWSVRQRFIEYMNANPSIASFPERVSIFGISALAPSYMEALLAASNGITINLFLMNPCKEYWAYITSDSEMGRTSRRRVGPLHSAEELYFEKGNQLLASMGQFGRDFFYYVYELEGILERVSIENRFEELNDGELTNMLSIVQSDILYLRERGKGDFPKLPIGESDSSIEIHSCHNPMREIEALYDNLLSWFDEDPKLEPRDIIVMTPDISVYAPFIESVFAGSNDSKAIPFSLADMSVRAQNPTVDGFMRLLELETGRFNAASVLSLLDCSLLLEAFGLDSEDVELIQRWVGETGICWGIDKNNRSKLGLPDFEENTWKAGVDRLIAGYAMQAKDDGMFQGILPYHGVEGSATETLGRFLDFLDKLFATTATFAESKSLSQWSELLLKALTVFFDPLDEGKDELTPISKALLGLKQIQTATGFDSAVELEVARYYLAGELSRDFYGSGFIMGRVTFCTMMPMRSIPFKIICVIGMNDSAFPRSSYAYGFDYTASSPRLGDPNRGKEDRYLFLEALLSARKRFYVSYVGQSLKDNRVIPPSVLVSELLDSLDQSFEFPLGKTASAHIVRIHRLSPFNQAYFRGQDNLFTYSEENERVSRKIQNRPPQTPKPFITTPLPKLDEFKTLDMNALIYFFKNPSQFFCNKRLGLYLDRTIEPPTEREPFMIDGLMRYSIQQDLIQRELKSQTLAVADLAKIFRSRGELPHGAVGDLALERLVDETAPFINQVKDYLQGEPKKVSIEIELSDFKLTGVIEQIYSDGVIHYRCAETKPKDLIQLWLYHLALSCSDAQNKPQKSMFIGADTVWMFSPLENGKDILHALLEKYLEGLSKPLHFFPTSSWAYAESYFYDKDKQELKKALEAAKKAWQGDEFNNRKGEGQDPYFKLCFGNVEPFDLTFQQDASDILKPLLQWAKQS